MVKSMQEAREKLGGIINITMTPFEADGSINYGALAESIERVLDLGYDGLLIGGQYGEFVTMNAKERAELLRKTMDFALNIPTDRIREMVSETGRLSRHKDPSVDKFKETGLTPLPGKRIRSPHIAECPINYECQVRSIVNMGSHDLFLGEVVGAFTDGKVETVETDEGYDRILMKREDGSVLALEWTTLVHEVR